MCATGNGEGCWTDRVDISRGYGTATASRFAISALRRTLITLCSTIRLNQASPTPNRSNCCEPHATTAEHALGFSAQVAIGGA